jgi:1,4-dihydroxy-6-naphthoate synthase
MNSQIRLAISTCPNDTFAFHALMHRLVPWQGLAFHIELLDIEELNQRALQEDVEVVKTSFAAALEVADRYWVLPSGSALGFGVGPLLLAARPNSTPESSAQLALCPGKHTTAALLFELFYPGTARVDHVVFSAIMPRLRAGEADFGICIHEGRFTWQEQNLFLVEDLGTRWEQSSGCPLPLGGILASRKLEPPVLSRVQQVVRDSLLFARQHPEIALSSMRQYAQEMNDQVLMQHVELYVNEWTFDLGSVGRQALAELSRRAANVRNLSHQPALQVFEPQL